VSNSDFGQPLSARTSVFVPKTSEVLETPEVLYPKNLWTSTYFGNAIAAKQSADETNSGSYLDKLGLFRAS